MIGAAMARGILVTLTAIGLALLSLDSHAQEALRSLPPILRTISDEVGALSTSEGQALGGIIADVQQERAVRIIVVIAETTMPESIESYTHRLRAHWAALRPLPDGVEDILVVVAVTDGILRIAAGVNMAPIVARISIDKVVTEVRPLLRSGKYFAALVLIIERLSQAIPKIDSERVTQARGIAADRRLIT
jgi:uncharacterized protein